MKQNAIERVLVEAFVAHLGVIYGHVGLHLEEVPDETTAGEIDGIAGPFAIEHTSIDSYRDQRTRGSFFERVVAPLEREIRPNRCVAVTVPHEQVARGKDFAEISAALRQWIISECAELAEGSHVIDSAPGLPFRFWVEVSGSRPSGLRLRRTTPINSDSDLTRIVRDAIERKSSKLARHHARGKATVLLLESRDIALMNEPTMRGAVHAAFPDGPPSAVDQIWYAETYPATAPTFYEFTTRGRGLAS